jgi:hypothetical protein
MADYYKAMPQLAKSVAGRIIDRLPVSTSNMSIDFRLAKFKDGIDYDPAVRNAVWLGAFKDTEIKNLLSVDAAPDKN